MNTLQEALSKSLIKKSLRKYNYYPSTKEELKSIVDERIKKESNNCNLNDIDVSKITDMSFLFYGSRFNGDISKWDVSNVENMAHMFDSSQFNQDISNWDISKVTNFANFAFKCPINGTNKMPKFK